MADINRLNRCGMPIETKVELSQTAYVNYRIRKPSLKLNMTICEIYTTLENKETHHGSGTFHLINNTLLEDTFNTPHTVFHPVTHAIPLCCIAASSPVGPVFAVTRQRARKKERENWLPNDVRWKPLGNNRVCAQKQMTSANLAQQVYATCESTRLIILNWYKPCHYSIDFADFGLHNTESKLVLNS
jgi:hypothetical protein